MLGSRILKAIGLTFASLLLFGVLASIYFLLSSVVTGQFSFEAMPEILSNSLFLTATLFGALLYFPIQVFLLAANKTTKGLLFVIPLLLAAAAILIPLYYLHFAPVDSKPVEDSFLIEYVRLGFLGIVFVLLNNLIIIRAM